MKIKKRLLSGLLALAAVFTLVPSGTAVAAEDTVFTDVQETAWYAEAVNWCAENSIMAGISSTAFSPNGTMTRSMLATVLYRAAGSPDVSGTLAYTDAQAGSWYVDALVWCAETALMTGYGNGTFGVNDPVSREQIAAVLWRQQGSPQAEDSESFADEAEISEYALQAVRWAKGVGILSGKGNNRFDPQGKATRAEVAAILYRTVQYSQETSETASVPDSTTAANQQVSGDSSDDNSRNSTASSTESTGSDSSTGSSSEASGGDNTGSSSNDESSDSGSGNSTSGEASGSNTGSSNNSSSSGSSTGSSSGSSNNSSSSSGSSSGSSDDSNSGSSSDSSSSNGSSSFSMETTTFTVNGVDFTMILVEAGTFTMGSDTTRSALAAHEVTLDQDYLMGETEVTQALWNAVMGNGGGSDTLPKTSVTWSSTFTFLEKMNQIAHEQGIIPENVNFHLPTEEQWEFAAKGGNLSEGYIYSGSNNIDEVAETQENSGTSPVAVKQKAPNELGLYDMSGNAYEWVDATESGGHVKKGGSNYHSFEDEPYLYTPEGRYIYSSTDWTIGFRICLY